MEYFIEVIIPLSLDTKYTYSVDPNQIKEISKYVVLIKVK